MNMHAEPPRAPPADMPTRALLWLTGVDEELLRRCHPSDWSACRALGLLLVLQWIYLTALFSLFVHTIFTPLQPVQPLQLLIALFIASFVIQIDSYMVVRSGFFLDGIRELKKAGYDISGGRAAQIKAYGFLVIRLILSIGLAQLTAVAVSLLIFSNDVAAGINAQYRQANAALIAQAEGPIDQDIAAARDAVAAEEIRHKALAAQAVAARQGQLDPFANEERVRDARSQLSRLEAQQSEDEAQVRRAEQFESAEMGGLKQSAANSGRAGNGPKHRAALAQLVDARRHAAETVSAVAAARLRIDELRSSLKGTAITSAQAVAQTMSFEEALGAETTQLDGLRQDYERKLAGRDTTLQHAIEHAPNYVPPATGFLTQIKLLEEIASRDNKITTLIILFDAVSFSLELAAVLAKVTSYVPTGYASLLASETFLRISQIGAAMATRLNAEEQDAADALAAVGFKTVPAAPTDGALGDELFGDGTPPKRRRGRPRKNEVH